MSILIMSPPDIEEIGSSSSNTESDELEGGDDFVDFSFAKEFKKFGKSFVKKARLNVKGNKT